MLTGRWASLVAIAAMAPFAALADAPAIDPQHDARYFGEPDNQLFWTVEQKVAGFRNMDKLTLTRRVAAGDDPYPLPGNPRSLAAVEITAAGETMSLKDYIRRQNVAGLIVVKDGQVVFEHYGLGNTASTRWISYSVAKSVTSLLVGAAIRDGYIDNVDEKVTNYLPRLSNSAYDEVTIHNLLQMASGVAWDEDYADPKSDINSVPWQTLSIYDYLRDKQRVAPPGELFNYNTAETNLVGTLLRAAIGNNLSTYLSEKIWKPFGMQDDAYWQLSEPGGGEFGGSSLNATLRDYARLGLFAMHNGKLQDGTRVLPDDWMQRSTSPSAGYDGYGYLWWLRDGCDYSAAGIFGQGIYIDPQENLVIAINSARADASTERDWALQNALYAAVRDALRDNPADTLRCACRCGDESAGAGGS